MKSTLADEAREVIRAHFGDEVPPLSAETWEGNIRQVYRGHWFDEDTLRFFGSRNRQLVRGGVMIECQTNAPEGVPRYAVTVWTLTDEPLFNGSFRVTPTNVGRFSTREAAKRFGVAVAEAWPR